MAETQVALADLRHLVTGAQTGKGQGRIFSCANDEMKTRRLALQKTGNQVVDREVVDRMVIIEDQRPFFARVRQPVDQRLNGLLRLAPGAGDRRTERGGQVGGKPGRLVVARVERKPGDRPRHAVNPLPDKGRLAESGGRADEGQPAARLQALVQPRDEMVPGDLVGPARGYAQLGREERTCNHRSVRVGTV